MAESAGASFGELLSRHRKAARLTREDLADRASIHWRTIAGLELGNTRKPHRDTVRLLADALELTGPAREEFEAAAHGSTGAVAWDDATTEARRRGDPHAWLAFVVATLDERGVAAARSAVTKWQARGPVDAAWLAWVEGLIRLTGEGRLPPGAQRPSPTVGSDPFLDRERQITFQDRERQITELHGFLDRVQHGRGGLALVLGPVGIGKSRLLVEALADRPGGIQVEWMTFDRGEVGYQGWRRLLAPLWITLRRTELAPASLLNQAATLDEVLLTGGDTELTRKPFPREVAAAIAALLVHLALRQPLVLVIDDAHRGGASSDHLLLDVAQRVSAYGVGLIAALRPEELDDDSPLRDYGNQAGGRAAMDLVTPIHVPPFDLKATKGLLRERTGVEPPLGIAEQVLRQTGGLPQLINSTQVQAPPTSARGAAWIVGKLDAEGYRALESAIHDRPEAARTVLQAAALCAVGGHIEPEVIARVTDIAIDFVERTLDEERQRGSILTPQSPGYSFQHDSWIDALIETCPPAQRRTLHARCLELLRADTTSDPRQLAQHAIRAGAALVGQEELLTLVSQAADLAMADYAFGAAAELYDEAVRHAAGAERIDLLIKKSDALRFSGRWNEARDVLKAATSSARNLGIPGREAIALVHLERLNWRYGLHETELTQQIRHVIERLPTDETVLRAQAQAALTTRLSITTRGYENEQADLARAALQQLPSVTDPLARADIIIGIRGGLQDTVSPEELLDFDRQVIDLAVDLHSAYHLEEALSGRIIDLIRSGRLLELSSALRAYRDFAELSVTSVATYTRALIDAMLALARGDFDEAGQHTTEAATLSEPWGESMAREALMGQFGWLLYETGQVHGLTEMLAGLPEQNVSSLNEPIWSLAAGLIHAEIGETDRASRILREVATNTRDFAALARGPSRIGILATAAMVLGHPAMCDELPPEEARRWGGSIADLLAAHQDVQVVAGWPAVFLGSKHRFIGLADLAAGQPAKAATHLTRAVEENSDFAVLHARARFDLARALLRQSASRAQGVTELEGVEQRASELGMAGLAEQAAAERDHQSRSDQ